LQPLKNDYNTQIDNLDYIKPKSKMKIDADGLKKWPVVSVIDDENNSLAYALLAKANDFDEILKVNKNDNKKPEYVLIRKKKGGCLKDNENSRATTISGNMQLKGIVELLQKDSESPLIVQPNKKEKWPGIITIHDISSHQTILSNSLQKAVQIEKLMTICLVNDGTLMISSKNGKQPVIIGTLDGLFAAVRKISGIGDKISREDGITVRDFRNLIAHHLISLTDVTPLPFYHHLLFLDGFLLTNRIHSLISDYVGTNYPEILRFYDRIYQFSKSRGNKSKNPMIANLMKNIEVNDEGIIFYLNQSDITMKKYQEIRSLIPEKYDDDTEWYDDCGKYLDFDPQKIQFIFEGLPKYEDEL
jgi:hypothetical protein